MVNKPIRCAAKAAEQTAARVNAAADARGETPRTNDDGS